MTDNRKSISWEAFASFAILGALAALSFIGREMTTSLTKFGEDLGKIDSRLGRIEDRQTSDGDAAVRRDKDISDLRRDTNDLMRWHEQTIYEREMHEHRRELKSAKYGLDRGCAIFFSSTPT